MAGRARVRSGLLAAAWAVLGVVGGHLLTYAALSPDAVGHDAALDHGGHAWMALVPLTVGTAALVALLLGVLGGGRQGPSRGVRFLTLALVQGGLFVALEVGERLGDGLALGGVGHEILHHDLGPVLLLGGLLQLVTAWLGSAVSRAVAALGDRVRAAAPPRRAAHRRPLTLTSVAAVGLCGQVHRVRGPPGRSRALVPIT